MNQKQFDLKEAGFLMLLLWLAVASFKAVCASVSKEICCCWLSLSHDCVKFCEDSGKAQCSVLSWPQGTPSREIRPLCLVGAVCACLESSSSCLMMESSFNTVFLLCLSSPGVHFWLWPCVLCDSLLHKYTLCIGTSPSLLWCLCFRWSIVLF